MDGISYPVALKDVDRFESLNDISVSVYGFEKEKVFPMHISPRKQARHHVNLLYLSKDESSHYVLIKDLSRLVTKQLSNHNGKKFICKLCLHPCHTKEILEKHLEKCQHHGAQRIKMPNEEDKMLYFKKIEAQERLPFTIYADFESILQPRETIQEDTTKSWTEKYQNHIPCSFGIYTVCSDKRFYSSPKVYFGKDSAEKFIDCVQQEAKLIRKYLQNKIPMERLSAQQWDQFNNASECYICKQSFNTKEKRVRNHDHLTGKYLC